MAVSPFATNPMKAGLADPAEKYPYYFAYLARKKAAGAEAQDSPADCGMAEAQYGSLSGADHRLAWSAILRAKKADDKRRSSAPPVVAKVNSIVAEAMP